MKTFAALALSFSSLMATVSAHGYIVSPPRRAPGAEMSAVCGSTIYNNQASDNAGPIQLLMQSASSIVDIDACNLWLCKGYQFADNTDQVQSYTLGQTIDMEVKIAAPHTGYANVSIVDTKTNTIKGSELKSWDVYASTATGVTADETNFSITIPTDLTGCTTAGGK
jgi:predicted carbohydrate-binding protein with CBM5 and CBM33 domain